MLKTYSVPHSRSSLLTSGVVYVPFHKYCTPGGRTRSEEHGRELGKTCRAGSTHLHRDLWTGDAVERRAARNDGAPGFAHDLHTGWDPKSRRYHVYTGIKVNDLAASELNA